MQIRHNLVVPEKPFFRRGSCVLKAAHHFKRIGNIRFLRMRIGSAIACMGICAALCALLWPHARDAGAILAAQDDPALLSDIQLDSALRNNQAMVAENIEAALAANDADLAGSFVDLAREKSISVSDELSLRVSNAVAEQNSTSHFAKRFATGLVTGDADDVASLSGTVAGDLFVFGDIRDVVREGKHLAMGEDTDRLILGLATAGLAESKGGQARAILKVLGRGALLLAGGAFNLTLWVFGALLALFGFLSSIKATTERLTQSWLDRKKARRLQQQMGAGVSA